MHTWVRWPRSRRGLLLVVVVRRGCCISGLRGRGCSIDRLLWGTRISPGVVVVSTKADVVLFVSISSVNGRRLALVRASKSGRRRLLRVRIPIPTAAVSEPRLRVGRSSSVARGTSSWISGTIMGVWVRGEVTFGRPTVLARLVSLGHAVLDYR